MERRADPEHLANGSAKQWGGFDGFEGFDGRGVACLKKISAPGDAGFVGFDSGGGPRFEKLAKQRRARQLF